MGKINEECNADNRRNAVDTKTVAKIMKMRDKGASYIEIAHHLGVSRTTVARYCKLEIIAMDCKPRKEEQAFIATEKTCGGCHYFRKLHSTDQRPNFCAYTLMTGKAKDITVPCAKCKLKRSE